MLKWLLAITLIISLSVESGVYSFGPADGRFSTIADLAKVDVVVAGNDSGIASGIKGTINTPVKFVLTTRNQFGKVVENRYDRIEVRWLSGPALNENVSVQVKRKGMGVYSLIYTPVAFDRIDDLFEITVNGLKVMDSNFNVPISSDVPEFAETRIEAEDVFEGEPAKVQVKFIDDNGKQIVADIGLDVVVVVEYELEDTNGDFTLVTHEFLATFNSLSQVYEARFSNEDFAIETNPALGNYTIKVKADGEVLTNDRDRELTTRFKILAADARPVTDVEKFVASTANLALPGDEIKLSVLPGPEVAGNVMPLPGDVVGFRDGDEIFPAFANDDIGFDGFRVLKETGEAKTIVKMNGNLMIDSPLRTNVVSGDIKVSSSTVSPVGLFDPVFSYEFVRLQGVGFANKFVNVVVSFDDVPTEFLNGREITIDTFSETGTHQVFSTTPGCFTQRLKVSCTLSDLDVEATSAVVGLQILSPYSMDVFVRANLHDVLADATRGLENELYLGSSVRIASALTDEPAETFFDGISRAVTLVDLDSDGNLDAVLSTNDKTQICTGNGQGGFACDKDLADNGGSNIVYSLDVDMDNDDDIIVLSKSKDIIYFNNGSGVFNENSVLPGSNGKNSVAAAFADLDGDLDKDIVVVRDDRSGNVIYLNDGANQFSDGMGGDSLELKLDPLAGDDQLIVRTNDVIIDDVNQDGVLDILLANDVTLGRGANLVYYGEQVDGKAIFETVYPFGDFVDPLFSLCHETGDISDTAKIVAIDLNMDQVNDFVLGNRFDSGTASGGSSACPDNTLMLSDSYGNLLAVGSFGLDNVVDMKKLDMNRDQFDDLLVLDDSGVIKLYYGNGLGSLSPVGAVLLAANATAIAVGDIDNDGFTDVIAVNGEEGQKNEVFLNTEDQLFTESDILPSLCDVDGLDISGITGCVNTGRDGDAGFGTMNFSALLTFVLLGLLSVVHRRKSFLLYLLLVVQVSNADVFLSTDFTEFTYDYKEVSDYTFEPTALRIKYARDLKWQNFQFEGQLLHGIEEDAVLGGELIVEVKIDWGYNLMLRYNVPFRENGNAYFLAGGSFVHSRLKAANFEALDGNYGVSYGLGAEYRITRSNFIYGEFFAYPNRFAGDLSSISIGIKHRY